MATYAIGDVQGCYDELQRLLAAIDYDEKRDQLWFTGDLVNRGPQSLKVLKFIKELPASSTIVTLGNHDLHLLAVHAGTIALRKKDTLKNLLNSKQCDEYIHWLRQQKLAHYDQQLDYLMVHAGVHPNWDFNQIMKYAAEIETLLRSEDYPEFMQNLYGDEPKHWHAALSGWDRIRFITNCFTRMRYCTDDGYIDLKSKGPFGTQEKTYHSWFNVPNRQSQDLNIVMGHWASLQGISYNPTIFAIDTGCVWGGFLTALCLETRIRTQVASSQHRQLDDSSLH